MDHHNQTRFQTAKPYIAVISLQLGYSFMVILSKYALSNGMSNYVFVIYRYIVAFLVLAPFAFYFERNVRPKMTIGVFFKILALAFLEPALDQNLYFLGVKATTASFAAALSNLVPAITFILAFILRHETINFTKRRSQAKILGTIVAVSGAMTMTLLKGPILFGKHKGFRESSGSANNHNFILGAVKIFIASICVSVFLILQTITLQTYPAALSLSAWICLFGAIINGFAAMLLEWRDPSLWTVKADIRLVLVLYAGIFCSGIAYYIQGVILKTKGPVFLTTFSPLCLIMVAILGHFILHEPVYTGRLVGTAVICLGLVLVIWGKHNDGNKSADATIEGTTVEVQQSEVDEDGREEN